MDEMNTAYPTLFNGEYTKLDPWVQNTDRRCYTIDVASRSVSSVQRENCLQDSIPVERYYKSDKLCTNRLGGQYSSGRPLPMPIREKIVELAKQGLKPCQISKQLQVSHGCVSKLLTRWRKTGSVQPERIGGSTPKKVLPYVATAIKVYKRWRPHLQTWQIRQRLITDGICTQQNVPSISSINKTLRSQVIAKPESPGKKESDNCLEMKKCIFSPTQHYHEKPSPPSYHHATNEYENYRNVLENNNNHVVPVVYGANFSHYSQSGVQYHNHQNHHQHQQQQQQQQHQYIANSNSNSSSSQTSPFNLNECWQNVANLNSPTFACQDVTPYYKYTYAEDVHTNGCANGIYMQI